MAGGECTASGEDSSEELAGGSAAAGKEFRKRLRKSEAKNGGRMRDDESISGIAEALEKLNAKLDGAVASGRRSRGRDRDEDAPRSVSSLERGRSEDPLEIRGVLFQVRVPIGRRGETMPAYLLFPPVRDERELEEVAEDVERRFKLVAVYQPKGDRGTGYSYGNGNGYNKDRGADSRGRDYGRDRERR
jgi:hypothetical protein